MTRRARKARRKEVDFLNNALLQNGRAMEVGPRKKKWTKHDLKSIKPLTPTQEELFHAWFNGDNICAHGWAGVGKSFLGLYLALLSVIDTRQQKRVIIIRSAVPTRDVGFLPGTLEEKVALYELPYIDICQELLGKSSSYEDMKEAGVVEFMTTSFVRGLTWDNAVVIVDEAQNLTFHELDSIITRIGNNTRLIILGDDKRQVDLEPRKGSNQSGFSQVIKVTKNMNSFSTIEFGVHDIVRSEFVKSWIIASEQTV